jgi:hypothetical protein
MIRPASPLALVVALVLCAAPAASAKRPDRCSDATARKLLKVNGTQLQVLRSGQYRAIRYRGGTWAFCDAKAPASRRVKNFNFDLNGQRNTGVRLLSRPGRCVALELRPPKGGYPSVSTVDMRPSAGVAGAQSTVNQIDFSAPGATIVRTALSSTCLLAIAYRSVSGSRTIELNPVIPPNVLRQRIPLGPAATDADLRSLRLKGDEVRWTDAGVAQSRRYAGLPPS